MTEHIVNVTIAIILIGLPILNTIQIFKIYKILTKN